MSNQSAFPSVTPLTYRAVYQRLARRLARSCEYLRTARYESPWFRELGRHYAINERNHICRTHINIEQLARDLGVIEPSAKVLGEDAVRAAAPADTRRIIVDNRRSAE